VPTKPVAISPAAARAMWLRAQNLDLNEPFGAGPEAARAAIAHLGYVQIDTINVIERCHHHILYSLIPAYRRDDLSHLQAQDKSVFEYWTHALSYVPTSDLPYFAPAMKGWRARPSAWFGSVSKAEVNAMTRRLKAEGPLSIRDIADDELVDKNHAWASRKPSKRVLELMFYQGLVTISAREGMVKTYDLIDRHFGWERGPRPASERQVTTYLLDRALRSQAIVSVDSICHLNNDAKPAMRALIEARVKKRQLVPVQFEGSDKMALWASPEALEPTPQIEERIHILSPFDPLIIQRKRLKAFFGYDHVFEAYVPAAKRQFGYFALPVLVGDSIVAAIDLKTDRNEGKLRIQKWTWLADPGAAAKAEIDSELGRFEAFQLGR